MLGNLKEFISVVQDGLTSNNNLRQTLHEVQKVTNIFKEKQKVPNESKVNYGAGGALLEKYQDQWVELHSNADNNAKLAEEVDKTILELHEVTKSRLRSAIELSHGLALLPNLTASVAQCVDSLKTVKTLLRDVEEQLVEFEDVVERNSMEKWKLDHHYHLSMYKEKKLAGLEGIRSMLVKENAEQHLERERRQLAELQMRREDSSLAFQVDMAKYLVRGTVPSATPPLPRVTLEQIQLDNDDTDLEKFLES